MQGKEDAGVINELSNRPEAEEPPPMSTRKSKSKSKSKTRFSDEQVRSLETIFELESKLEPRKKVQVATELGLQPRQVAIWFQNKRARWKAKQIEKNYRLLKANYDNLKARFEAMRKDKESLLQQLKELCSLFGKSHQGCNGYKEFGANNIEYISKEKGVIFTGIHGRSSSLNEEDYQGVIFSDNGKNGSMACYYQQEESPQLINIRENINGGSVISPVKWCNYDAAGSLDQSSTAYTSSHWWQSWT